MINEQIRLDMLATIKATIDTLKRKTEFTAAAVPEQWDGLEIRAVKQNGNSIEACQHFEDADFWSVYLTDAVDGTAACIADLPTSELAEDLLNLIETAADRREMPPAKVIVEYMKLYKDYLADNGLDDDSNGISIDDLMSFVLTNIKGELTWKSQ